MAESFNEDDDLRRLKEWWKQNGMALILGVGAGLAAIAGWQWWKAHVESQAYSAAGTYQEFSQILAAKGPDNQALQALETLKDDYKGTAYPARASMDIAARLVQADALDKAIPHLEWVVANGQDDGLRQLARSRQARLLWASGEEQAALKLLSVEPGPAFKSLFSEIAGDIHAAAGRNEQARAAYGIALRNLPEGADPAPLQLKLESVGGKVAETDANMEIS